MRGQVPCLGFLLANTLIRLQIYVTQQTTKKHGHVK